MLQHTSSQTQTTSTTQQTAVKSLISQLPAAESKTPESEESAPQKQQQQQQQQSHIEPEEAFQEEEKATGSSSSSSKQQQQQKVSQHQQQQQNASSSLSTRAGNIKSHLQHNEIVSAVILKADGSSEEIEYNTSSNAVNKLLGGRPTIIGELEEIQVIIVRSLSAKSKESNKNILPVPFCNKSYNGDYLLYRVNSESNPINLTLNEYNKYVESTKTLTDQAIKHYDPIDGQEIKHKSLRNTQSKLTLILLRSEVDKKIRNELKEKNSNNKPNESEIEKSVNIELQKFVDELVMNSSPMNDPDYNPNDDEQEQQQQPEEEEEENEQQQQERKEIIEKIQNVYSEEHENDNIEITEDDINKQFKSIQQYLSKNSNENDDDYEEIEELDEEDWRIQLNDALNYVRARGKADGQLLATKISETFYELNGNDPSLDELIETFRRIQNELAQEAAEDIEALQEQDNGSAHSLAQQLGPKFEDADPSDLIDYAFRIVREDMISRAKSSFLIAKGRSPSQSELEQSISKFAEKLASEAILQNGVGGISLKSLQSIEEEKDGDYDPNNINDQQLKNYDQIENEEFDENYFNLKMLSTPIKKSKTAQNYNVYFNNKFTKKQEKENLNKAINSFKIRNKREPNAFEINNLCKFLKTDYSNTSIIEFEEVSQEITDDNDQEIEYEQEEKDEILSSSNYSKSSYHTTPTKVLVTPIKKKKSSSKFNIYLNEEFNVNKNERTAIKWFERFNSRKPTKEEQDNIKQFVKADKSGLTVCNFDIEVSDDEENDDSKQTEENDQSTKVITKSYVNKDNSTKYTLNFDDQDKVNNGDEKQAIKWFKRFNQRAPTNDEQKNIQSFIQHDANNNTNNNDEDTIDID